jgi:hypothetical protein
MGELLTGAFDLYRRNARLVLAVTVPIIVVVTGLTALGLGELGARYSARPPLRDTYIALAANQLVTVPLISSILARWVLLVQRGERTSATDLVANALEVFPSVLLVIIVWLAVVFVGLSLVVPGLYILVSWYFVVQAVVIDGHRGLAPIAGSAALVRGHWWQSALVGAGFQLAAFVPQGLIVFAFTGLARAANAYVVVVVGAAIASVLTLPFLAIGSTLYYLQLRAARGPAPRAAAL